MKRMYCIMERRYWTIYAFLVIVCSIMYLSMTIGHTFWYDEAYTMALVKYTFSEIWKITAADVHPPLYYILLKLFLTPFGDSVFMAEVFSILPFVLIIAIGGIWLKKLFNSKTAVLFMILFFLFPYAMSYAVEIRMYSLAALFVFLTAVCAFCCHQEKNRWLYWELCACFGACAAYTHYFALVSVGIIYALLLVAAMVGNKKRIRNWMFMAVLTVVLYLPWIKCFIGQLVYKVDHEYWIPPITIKSLLSYAYFIFGSKGVTVFVLFSGSCYVAALIYIILAKNKADILIALSALAVPVCTILTGVTASVAVRPVFIVRYCIPSLPLLVFFMAFVMGKLSNDLFPAICLTVFLIGGIGNYEEGIISKLRSQQIGFEDLLPEGSVIPKTIVVYNNDSYGEHIAGVLAYYYPDSSIYRQGSCKAEASPFKNLYVQDSNINVDGNFLLLLKLRQQIPEEFQANYDCQYIGETNRYEFSADVYLLIPNSSIRGCQNQMEHK